MAREGIFLSEYIQRTFSFKRHKCCPRKPFESVTLWTFTASLRSSQMKDRTIVINIKENPINKTSLCLGWNIWPYAVSPFFSRRWKEQRLNNIKLNPEKKIYNDVKMFARYEHAFFSLHLSKQSALQNSPNNWKMKEQSGRVWQLKWRKISNTYMSSRGWKRSTKFMGGSEGQTQKWPHVVGKESCIFLRRKGSEIPKTS